MPLGVYLRVVDIVKDDTVSIESRNVQIISLLSGIPEEELLNMPIADMRKYSDTLDFLHEEPKIGKPKKTYTLGMHQCEVQIKPEKLTTAQYIDFKELAGMANDKPEVVLSIFLVPKGKRYNDGYDVEEVQRAILDRLPATDAQSILAFFLRRWQESTVNTMYCSLVLMEATKRKMKGEKREQMKKNIEKMKEAIYSFANGGGLTTSILLPSLPAHLGMRCM